MAAAETSPSPAWLRVEDGSDRWAPSGSDTERGTALSAAAARWRCARGCWAAWAADWAAQRRKEGGGENRPQEGFGPKSTEREEEKINTFLILFSNLCLISLQENLKTFLKFKITTQTK